MVLVLVAGCGASRRQVNVAGVGLAVAALAADWYGTRAAASDGWYGGTCKPGHYNKTGGWVPARYIGQAESGFPAEQIMGRTPSTRTVDVYFAGWIVGTVALWALVPERWRLAVPGVVIGAEVPAIVNNARVEDDPWCG